MILLFVWGRFTNSHSEDEYNRALYRILNEETNQTLDQSLIKKAFENEVKDIRIEDSEGEEEPGVG